MVEVFKTNVHEEQQAKALLGVIHKTCVNYKATFDLDDCDKILRIQCDYGSVHSSIITNILLEYGYFSEVLEDEVVEVRS